VSLPCHLKGKRNSKEKKYKIKKYKIKKIDKKKEKC